MQPPADPQAAKRRDNHRGIRLMTLAMAGFVFNDALVKYASQSLPAGQIMFLRGVLATLLVLVAMRSSGVPVQARQLASGWVPVRAIFDGLATLTYIVSLTHLPIANATAINMGTPIFITVLAVLWLGARVSALRWGAVAAGFAGVLLVIQPSAEGFNAWAWLCLLATLLTALRDLVTTRIARDVPTLAITLATAVTVTVMAGILSLVQGWAAMTPGALLPVAGAAVFLTMAYQLVIRATRSGDLSVIAPFRYSALLLAVALGWVIWGDVPNALAWAGIALVIAAGLVLLR